MADNLISPRLLWFAERVRGGVTFADIGTDHAKLPVYLVKNGKVACAVASDIGEGPIAHARAHIGINGLSDKIKTFVGDGISHLDIETPADIAICGMGGETIVGILMGAPFVKNKDIRLLLQPMTDFAFVRNYLAKNGFYPIDEDIVESDGKLYQCMVVCFNGETYSLTNTEAQLGKLCIEKRSSAFLDYVGRRYNIVKKCCDGKSKAGLDISEETALLADYDKILKGEL